MTTPYPARPPGRPPAGTSAEPDDVAEGRPSAPADESLVPLPPDPPRPAPPSAATPQRPWEPGQGWDAQAVAWVAQGGWRDAMGRDTPSTPPPSTPPPSTPPPTVRPPRPSAPPATAYPATVPPPAVGSTPLVPSSFQPGQQAGSGEPSAVLLDALFDRGPVGFALHDASGRYVRVNEVLARFTGRPVTEHLGRTMAELLGDIGHEMDGLLARVLRTGEPVTDLEVSVATGGTGPPQTWSASWYPAVDARGAVGGAVLVAVEVTRLREAESGLARAEARYRALAGSAGSGGSAGGDLFHAERDGSVDVDLPYWRSVTGQHPAQTVGFGWLDALHPDDRDRIARDWRAAVERQEVFDAEFRIRVVEGLDRYIAARAVPVVDGRSVEWVGVFRDVSEAAVADAARAEAVGLLEAAERRAELSHRLTVALGRAVTVEEVINAVLDAVGPAVKPTGRGIALIDEQNDTLRFRSLLGYSADHVAHWSEVGLGAIHPLAEAVRVRRPLYLTSREELTVRWPVPDLVAATEASGERAWALLPLATTDAPFGVLHLGFPAAREFAVGERVFLAALADQCAQALERVTLYERLMAEAAEGRRAQETAEAARAAVAAAESRLDQLARATTVVAAATDTRGALAALADLVAGEIADVCVIDLVVAAEGSTEAASDPASNGPEPMTATTSTAASDARVEDAAVGDAVAGDAGPAVPIRLRPAALAVRPGAPIGLPPVDESREIVVSGGPLGSVIRTGAPGLVDLSDHGAGETIASPAVNKGLRALGGHTAAVLPVLRDGRVAAVMTVVAVGERPPIIGADLSFLAELAAHATAALARADVVGGSRGEAVALRRALLPRPVVPVGLDVIVRYLPAQDGEVGGDWFDVVDLGAGRVALMIGEVAGRGVQAALVMGQLRAAARTCARLDLPSGEILAILDRMVADLPGDHIATCIHAVIATDSGMLTLASAGHPPPLVVAPDGLVSRLYMAVGTPLGLARDDLSDFQVTEYTVSLGPGYLLALFTEGLVRGRDLDIDAGVSNLAATLARPADEWDGRLADLADAACATRTRSIPAGRDDDIALLLARLPAAEPGEAGLDVTADPSAGLNQVRAQVRLELENAGFVPDVVDTVVLVLSELVGNALVHGRPPLSVRVRRLPGAAAGADGRPGAGSRLLIEVGDGGGRLPRRRRAGPDDEAGRGLDLVGLLAARWGARPVGGGKVVWAEIEPAPAGA